MKPIPSCPNYFACENGHIHRKGRQLKERDNGRGYLKLAVSINGKLIDKYIHRLVCEAYQGPCPAGMECRHKDGNKHNNLPTNLAWGTPAENVADKVRHGSSLGERNGSAKLTFDDARKIRELYSAGNISQAALGKIFGVKQNAVRRIVSGEGWLEHRRVE